MELWDRFSSQPIDTNAVKLQFMRKCSRKFPMFKRKARTVACKTRIQASFRLADLNPAVLRIDLSWILLLLLLLWSAVPVTSLAPVEASVTDPDPYVFEHSGSVSTRLRIRILL